MIGNESSSPNGPCQRCTSVPQSVEAVIFTSSEPGSSLGIGTCCIVRGLLCSVITAARQVSMINPFIQRDWLSILTAGTIGTFGTTGTVPIVPAVPIVPEGIG